MDSLGQNIMAIMMLIPEKDAAALMAIAKGVNLDEDLQATYFAGEGYKKEKKEAIKQIRALKKIYPKL